MAKKKTTVTKDVKSPMSNDELLSELKERLESRLEDLETEIDDLQSESETVEEAISNLLDIEL